MEVTMRNELIMKNESVIYAVIRRNWVLIRALHLDVEDVYQDLYIAAMRAVEGFDSKKSDSLQTHLASRLQYEIRNLKRRYKPYGMTGAYAADIQFCSLDDRPEGRRPLEIPSEAPFSLVEFKEALEALSPEELSVVDEKIRGVQLRTKKQRTLVCAAQEKLQKYYERGAAVCY